MTTGFHWTYGVVQQQTATGGGGGLPAPPTVGLAATNLGNTNTFSFTVGTGAGGLTVNPVPQAQPYGSGEHTVQVNTTFSAGSGTINMAFLEVINTTASATMQFPAQGIGGAVFNAFVGRQGRDMLAWMGNSDVMSVLLGGGGIDVTYPNISNPNSTIDVVASNAAAAAAGLTQNVFYFNFQELAQSTAGVSTAGGFNANHIASGDQIQFNFYVRNSNGLTNNATSTITIT